MTPQFRGAWHLSKHFWNCCVESVPVSLVNPHPCWEQLFLETMKVILAKFGQWGHSRAGGCGDGVVWTDNQSVSILLGISNVAGTFQPILF